MIKLGLKWKILALTSAIFAAAIISVGFLQYQILIDQQTASRRASHLRYLETFDGLLVKSADDLRQVAKSILFVKDIENALVTKNQTTFNTYANTLWPMISFEQDIDLLSFHTPEGKLITTWGEVLEQNEILINSAMQAINTETPFTVIECKQFCTQIISVPVQVSGKIVGAISVGTSLADIMLGFKRVTGADIALITSISHIKHEQNRSIENWGSTLVAITLPANNRPVIQQLSAQVPDLEEAITNKGNLISYEHRYIDILVTRLNGIHNNTVGHLLVLSDHTKARNDIQKLAIQTALIIFTSIVLAEAILLVLLGRLNLKDPRLEKINETLSRISGKDQ